MLSKPLEAAAKALFDFANGYSVAMVWGEASRELKNWHVHKARAAIEAAVDALTDELLYELMPAWNSWNANQYNASDFWHMAKVDGNRSALLQALLGEEPK